MRHLNGVFTVLLFVGASASASVIDPGVTSCSNGAITLTGTGFSSSTWGACGNATGTGPTGTIDSTDITQNASVATLESFLKLPSDTLNEAFLQIAPAPGSAIAQSFSTTVGGTISFDFVLTAEAFAPASTFFAINGLAFELAFHPPAQIDDEELAPSTNLAILPAHESFAAPAGAYTVGFGIVGQEPSFDPAVTISNLAFTSNGPEGPSSVPEPSTRWLTLPVLVVAVALRRRGLS